jgi:transposase
MERNGMTANKSKIVLGPDGEALSINDLPKERNVRWTIRRKAIVAACVQGGLIGLPEVEERYGISVDEFMEWKRDLDRGGMDGLKVTKMQRHRETKKSRAEAVIG